MLGETLSNKMSYAGLGRRFAALVVDFLIFCIVFFPVTKITKGVWIMSATDHLWGYGWLVTDPLCLIFLAVIALYFIFLEGFFGVTIGKKLLGIGVIGLDGRKPGLMRSIIRNLLRIVDSLPALNILGVYLILSSPEKARFGDRVAKTRVIMRH
jgi:uncharacterized RDD family membrane protein YckC